MIGNWGERWCTDRRRVGGWVRRDWWQMLPTPLHALCNWEQDVALLRSALQLPMLSLNIWEWVLISLLGWGELAAVRSLWHTWLHTSNKLCKFRKSRNLPGPQFPILPSQMFLLATKSFPVTGILSFGFSDLRESNSICGVSSLLVVEMELLEGPMRELWLPYMR